MTLFGNALAKKLVFNNEVLLDPKYDKEIGVDFEPTGPLITCTLKL
jgi:hypothetical protein